MLQIIRRGQKSNNFNWGIFSKTTTSGTLYKDMGRKRFINFFLFSRPFLPDQMRPKGQRVVHFQGSSLGKAKKQRI